MCICPPQLSRLPAPLWHKMNWLPSWRIIFLLLLCSWSGWMRIRFVHWRGKAGMLFMWLPGKDEAPESETCTKWCPAVHLQKEESFQLPWKHKHRLSVYPGSCKSHSSARSTNILGSNLTITSTETWIYSQCYLSRNMRGCDFFFLWRGQIPVQETGDPLWV